MKLNPTKLIMFLFAAIFAFLLSSQSVYSAYKNETVTKPIITLKETLDIGYIYGFWSGEFAPDRVIGRHSLLEALENVVDIEYSGTLNIDEELIYDDDSNRRYLELLYLFHESGIIDQYNYIQDYEITRAAFMEIVYLLIDAEPSPSKSMFTDVEGHWAETYITAIEKLGYIKGYGDGTFRPDNFLTRGEFIAVINRIVKIGKHEHSPFIDGYPLHWAYDDIRLAGINVHPGPYSGAGTEYEQEYKYNIEGYRSPSIDNVIVDVIDAVNGVFRLTVEYTCTPGSYPFLWWRSLYHGTFSECSPDYRTVLYTLNEDSNDGYVDIGLGDSMGRVALTSIFLSKDAQ